MIYLRLFPWLLSSTGGFLPVFVLSRRLLLFHTSLSFFSSLQLYRKLKWPFFSFPFPGRDLSASRSVQPHPHPDPASRVCQSTEARRLQALLVFQELQPPLAVLRSHGRVPGRLSLLYQAAALQARQKQRRRDELSLAWGGTGGNVCFAARLQLE